jgi:inhibitor of cysteine peptidase
MRRVLVFPVLLLAACATVPAMAAVASGELENAADGTRISIKRGGELKVLLDANITTGYQWQSPTRTEPVLAPAGEPVYAPRTTATPMAGAGGTTTFRFRADNPGSVILQFDYRRPWETAVPPARTLRYVVTVE